MYRLIALLLLCACSAKAPPPPAVYKVKTSLAVEKETPLFLEALGHVEPINSVEVLSRIEGELMEVLFTEGREVSKGDLLFTIDPRPYEIRVREAEAQVQEAQAKLSLAQERVTRYAPLARDEYISQLNYETLQTELTVHQATLARNQATLDHAKLELSYCWIAAPIDGLTGILKIERGNLIGADKGQPLVSLNQMSPIYVTFSIPEVNLPRILQAGPQLPVEVSLNDATLTGKLQMIDNAVDRKTGMVKLRGIFANDTRMLWPGLFVRSRLILDHIHATVIPYTAIQVTTSGPLVFVVKPDKTVEARSVQLGQREDLQIIVTQGIHPGETIVTEGQINLVNGAQVEPL